MHSGSTLPRSSRLLKSASYGAVLSSPQNQSVRCSTELVSLAARQRDCHEGETAVRFGFTVGKANAHRSVDRALIKRIFKESARHQRQTLQAAGICGDIVIRLKRRIPKIGQEVSLSDFKKKLREECDLAFKIFARRALVHWEAHR